MLSLPAIAEVGERHLIDGPLGWRYFLREPGDILHPTREDLVSLNHTRATIGAFSFAAQYQQCPIPLGGAIIRMEWLRFYEPGEEPARFQSILQSWDTANKSGELNDYCVCTTWGVAKNAYYLLDVVRKRLNFPDLKQEVRRLHHQFKPNRILIEDKASGTQLLQSLKDDGVFRIAAYTPPPGSDKIMRLHAQSAVFENGRVLLPKSAPWLADFIAELTGFPGTRYANQVDSTTQALDYRQTQYRRDWMSRVDWDKALRVAGGPGPSRWRS